MHFTNFLNYYFQSKLFIKNTDSNNDLSERKYKVEERNFNAKIKITLNDETNIKSDFKDDILPKFIRIRSKTF